MNTNKPKKVITAFVKTSYTEVLLRHSNKPGDASNMNFWRPNGKAFLTPLLSYKELLDGFVAQQEPLTVEELFNKLYNCPIKDRVAAVCKVTKNTEWFLEFFTGPNQNIYISFSDLFWLKSWEVYEWYLNFDVLNSDGKHQTLTLSHLTSCKHW